MRGRKLWVLFPPRVDKRIARGRDLIRDGEDDEPINYFVDILPRIRRKYGDSIERYEFVQYPGETVFIPGGWHHAVLNLDDTLAVTQNFCSRNNFEKVWRKTRTGRKKMAIKWLRELEKAYPALAQTARRLNDEDGFVMAEERRERSGSQEPLDGDDENMEKKRKKKHKRKGTSDVEDQADSGSGSSSHKKGRRDRSVETIETRVGFRV